MAGEIKKLTAKTPPVIMIEHGPFMKLSPNAPVVENNDKRSGEEEEKSNGYLIHKLGKQAIYKPLLGWGCAHNSFATYQTLTSRRQKYPNDPIFADKTAFIYRDNMAGRTMKRLYLPKEYRSSKLSNEQLKSLDDRGQNHLSRQGRIFQVAEGVRFLADGLAIASCTLGDSRCATQEIGIVGMDGALAFAWIFYGTYINKGGTLVDRAAYAAFRTATRVRFGANLLMVATGFAKMGNEIYNYAADKTVNSSAFVDGVTDAGWAGAYGVYAHFLLKESAKELGKTGNIKSATDVMSVSARVIPTVLLRTMQGIAVVGSAWNIFSNGTLIYDGSTRNDLSEDQKTRLVISGYLGVASSLASLGFGIFIALSTPLGQTLFLISVGLLVAQTLCDEWEAIKTYLAPNNGTYQPFGSPFRYAFPAQKNPDLITSNR